ncbi:hypothetical protein [Rhodomicrobium udaipurense]|nr:hypothetical protein [Rhodomicrobium udaipurense]
MIGEQCDFRPGQRRLLHDGNGDGIVTPVRREIAVLDYRDLIQRIAEENAPENRAARVEAERSLNVFIGGLNMMQLGFEGEMTWRHNNDLIFFVAIIAAKALKADAVSRNNLQHACSPAIGSGDGASRNAVSRTGIDIPCRGRRLRRTEAKTTSSRLLSWSVGVKRAALPRLISGVRPFALAIGHG